MAHRFILTEVPGDHDAAEVSTLSDLLAQPSAVLVLLSQPDTLEQILEELKQLTSLMLILTDEEGHKEK